MDKKLIILLSLAILVLLSYFFLPSLPTDNGKVFEQIVVDVPAGKNAKKEVVPKTQESSFESPEDALNQCGDNRDDFYKAINGTQTKNMNEDQIDHLDYLINSCDQWFIYLEKLDPELSKNLISSLKEKMEIIDAINVFEYSSLALNKAREHVASSDVDISSRALIYLIQFDHEFMAEVAHRMGVSDTSFLRNNYHPVGLYSCLNSFEGYDCSSTSLLMKDLCNIDESACNKSYPAWVQTQVTVNQYDDYLYAISVINDIVHSDWFETLTSSPP